MTKQLAVLSESDLQRVPEKLRIFNKDQLKLILTKTPESQIKKRKGRGGEMWSYVNGAYTTKMLNLVFGFDWDFKVLKHEFDLDIGQAYVLGELTVRVGERSITKQQFGRVDIKFLTETRKDDKGQIILNDWEKPKRFKTKNPMDIGNDLKAAATDSLKKCASVLGFFSDVYYAEDFLEMKIVGDDEKEDYKNKAEIENLKAYLIRAKNLDEIDEIETKYFNSKNGEVSQEAEDLIKAYKSRIKK